MGERRKTPLAALALLLGLAVAGQAYERELTSRSLRRAYFLGKDTNVRSTNFLKDYVRTFPRPKQGVHVQRISIATPFKEMVDRARRALDGYHPLRAEADYRRQPPPLTVEVALMLTPTYPAHSPYTIPTYQPVYFREPDFWQAFEIRLVQAGQVTPLARRGRPLYSCDPLGGCWLTGAVVTLEFDPEQVGSRPTEIIVVSPDGQRMKAEFDLARLR